MRKKAQHWIVALLFVTTMGGATFALAAPQTANAACSSRLLTFPTWYNGLTDGSCNIKSPKAAGGISVFIWKIVLNVVDMGLQAVGYITVGFIIRGGFKYMTAVGDPGEVAKAKKTITDAVIGLVIAIFAVAIVNLISGAVK